MLSLLLFAVYTALLAWPGRLSLKRAPALVVLMPLWVNLHGGFIFGLLLIGLVMLTSAWGAVVGTRARRAAATERARVLAVVLAGCVAGTVLNPNTWRLLLYPFSYLGNNASVRYITEWESPNFHEGGYLFFEALLFALLIALAVRARRPALEEVLIPLVFAYLGLQSVRNIPLFCVVAVPVIVMALQDAYISWRTARPPRAVQPWRDLSAGRVVANWVMVVFIAALTLTAALPLASAPAARRAEAAAFPTGAVAFLRRHDVAQPLFNSYNWGGYLIWTLYPRYRVYIDGRPDMYGDAYVDGFMAAYDGDPRWRAILDRGHIASVLVEPGSVLAKLLALSPGWRRLYADSQAVLYTRAGARAG
jgi:hypothetical protein